MSVTIALWLRAWVLACLCEIFPLSITGETFTLIADSLNIPALCSLSEGFSSIITRFLELIYTPLFMIAVGYFDTS